MLKKILVIATVSLIFSGLNAQILKMDFPTKEEVKIKKWQVLDLKFKAKSKDPLSKDFYATFTSPQGKEQKVPGFYNDNNEWVIRFSASEGGLWKFNTNSDVKSLNNKTGEITVRNYPIHEHKGAIVIPEDDPQHFYYEDGDPYFLMAFECDWLYSLDYDNEEGLPKTDHLLNLIKENGINQVVMNVYTHDVSWEKDELLSKHPEHEFGGLDHIFPFLGSNKEPDFSSLNIDYFKKLDRTISMMHDKNITSHLMIYVWNKLVNWPDMNTDADNLYFDYVVKRYGAFPNIMWDISKEALFYGRADDNYILERIERLQKQNYFNRTVSVHDYGFCKRHPEKVDYISRQDWTFELYNNMVDDYHKYADKPIFNIEHGGYEESPYVVFSGAYIDAKACLRRNYQCAFAGAYSTYYWQGTSWNTVIWNPFEQPDDFYKPKFEYFKHMTWLFNEVDFEKYKPLNEQSRAGYILKEEGKENYLVYSPSEVYWLNLRPAVKTKTDTVYYRWFNTLTGEVTPETMKVGRGHVISPFYGQADAVVIIRKATEPQVNGKDYVLIEAESTKSDMGLWIKKTIEDENYVPNASSQAHIEFTGNTINGGKPSTELEYTFVAPSTGTYKIALRARKRLEGEKPDKCNDAYIKLDGDFESGNTVPLERLKTLTKMYGGFANEWGWASNLDAHDADHIECLYKLKEGEKYTLTIAGRSIRFNIDYILLYNNDNYEFEKATRELKF